MIYRFLLALVAVSASFVSCRQLQADSSSVQNLPDLLHMLDDDLDKSSKYDQIRQGRIAQIHAMDDGLPWSDESRYRQNRKLYDEFFPYQFDSAFHYINENLILSEKMHDSNLHAESTVELAMLFTIAGMYLEAKEVLDSQIDTSMLDNDQLLRYYIVQHRFNRDFHENSKNPAMANQVALRLKWYRNRLVEVLPENSNESLSIKIAACLDEGNYEVADSVNKILLSREEEFTHKYAMYAYEQALIDYALGRETFRHWYVRSAIGDVRSAVKDNASIASMARQLFEDEDIERAFRYITASMDDAIFYNAKLRPWQIAQIMPVIEKTYAEKMAASKRMRNLLSIVASLAALIILVFSVVLYKTYVKIRCKAEELNALNIRLSELNVAVSEANSVKEEYIAMLLSMCSDYIDKIDSLQQDMKRKVKVGMTEELLKELSSTKLMKQELDNFYKTFDTAFLKLYPDFVNEFNQLLHEDERIVLPKNSLLNAELRIFALIRLGITDSSRIAVLLRYSVQTIYNYRMRMKKRSIYDRDEFEKRLLTIGSFRH